MKKMKYLCLALVIFIGLGSCRKEKTTSVVNLPVKVKVEAVQEVVEQTDYYIGNVEESVSVPLSFLTTGMVEEVTVVEGQYVNKGQILARLNTESYENAYQIALAKEKQAKDAYERLSELYKKGSLPEIKFVEIETGLAQVQAASQIARKNIQDCVLNSPTDGYIGKRSIEPGSNAIPGMRVLTLVKIDKVFIKVSVPEKEISSIKSGNKAIINIPALNGASFEGKVAEKSVIANPISHTYDVRISVNNNSEKLMPGMICKVSLLDGSIKKGLIILQRAVQSGAGGEKFVYIPSFLEPGKLIKRIVETGDIMANGIVIIKGLNINDSVVVEGYQKLDENSTIQIIK